MVVSGLTQCALFHFMCDLKVAQMNIQYSLIPLIILYKFKLGQNAVEANKNICCVKKFHKGCKKVDDQASGPKMMN